MTAPLRLSWAKLQALEACNLQFDLKYIQRVQVPSDQSIYIVGRVVHDAFKVWASDGYPRSAMEPLVRDQFKKQILPFRRINSERIEAWRMRAVKGANSVERMAYTLKFHEHPVSVEHRFKVEIPGTDGAVLEGGYDVYDPAGAATLYDWKMYSKYEPPTFGQLLTYGVGLRAEGKPVRRLCFLYPLLTKKYDAIQVTDSMLDAAEAKLVNLAQELRRGAGQPVQPDQGPHCRYCAYRGKSHCPATFRAGVPSRDGRAFRMGFRETS